MSVGFSTKLNIPGVKSLKSGSSTGVSTSRQAAVNLSSSSVARGSTSYSLKSTNKNGWVPANSLKGNTSRYNYQGIRARLNGGSQIRGAYATRGTSRTTSATNISVDNGSAYQTGQIVGQVLSTGISLLNQLGVLGGGSKTPSATNSQKLDSAMGSLSKTVSIGSSSQYISDMTKADNSSDLRQAISAAETRKSELSSLVGDETKYQSDCTQIKGEVSKLESDVKTAEKTVSTAKQKVGESKQQVSILTTTRDTKKNLLTNAMTKKNQCSKAYADAHANTVSAQASLDSANKNLQNTPQTNPDGSPNPAYTAAKEAKTKAEAALAKAKTAEENAKTDMDKANEAAINADKDVKEAEKNLQAEQKKLDNAEENQKTAEEKQKTAESDLKEKKADLEEKKTALEKLETSKKEYDKLTSEIPEQQNRLKELEQKEQKEYDNLSTKIDKKGQQISDRASQIDTSDGMSLSEKMKKARNDRAEAKMDKMSDQKDALADNLAKTNLLKDSTNVTIGADGSELRSGNLPSGKKVYFIGTKEVNQAEYDAAMNNAKK